LGVGSYSNEFCRFRTKRTAVTAYRLGSSPAATLPEVSNPTTMVPSRSGSAVFSTAKTGTEVDVPEGAFP
jgi:hypothetical protein